MVIPKALYENELYRSKTMSFLAALWIEYKDLNNYILAFVHRSFVNEKSDVTTQHNERLEFLWDAVLELVVTDKLYREFPEKPEWELTDIRSSIVRWRNLALVAKNIGIPDNLILWKWEDASGWRDNDYILANTVEAILWAIYLDLGYSVAEEFILTHIYSRLSEIMEEDSIKDPKSLLQEFAQAGIWITPTYEVLDEVGPDHDKIFTVWVYLWEIKLSEGKGWSKKKAQENAAFNAFSTKEDWEKDFEKKN